MALPALSTNAITAPHAGLGHGNLGAPKTVRSRGTYEGLGGVQEQVRRGQTGQGLRESYAARQQERTSAMTLANTKTNTLVAQAGLPSSLNRTPPQSTADVLAVRMQRQNFMFRVAS
jgi:hypothetical protein